MEISIKGSKGQSIEEADDWKKNLKTKYRNQINKPEVTEVTEKKVKEEFSELLKHIDKELSEFYSVFTSVNWEPNNGNYDLYNDNKYYASIYFFKEFGNIKTGFNTYIELTIQQFLYKIEVSYNKWEMPNVVLYNKELSYTESLTDQDKEDIVNVIGNLLNQFIETQGFTTHGPRF